MLPSLHLINLVSQQPVKPVQLIECKMQPTTHSILATNACHNMSEHSPFMRA